MPRIRAIGTAVACAPQLRWLRRSVRSGILIANRGNAPTADDFWVDVYINPNPIPTAVNQIWQNLADEGLVWGVETTLQPGEALTLTVGGDHYVAAHSEVSWPLAVGTSVYAQVDSANANTDYGAVLEDHEIRGEPYNNVSAQVISVAEAGAAGVDRARLAWHGDPWRGR